MAWGGSGGSDAGDGPGDGPGGHGGGHGGGVAEACREGGAGLTGRDAGVFMPDDLHDPREAMMEGG